MTALSTTSGQLPAFGRTIPRIDPSVAILRRIAALQRIRRLTKVLDTRWKVPGTKCRFGLDPVIGLIPAIGGLVTLGASIYALYLARRIGAPWSVLLPMSGNILIDFLVGEVPIVGDVFDFAFKAHARNLRILERWMARAPS